VFASIKQYEISEWCGNGTTRIYVHDGD